jgi:hypothetical protein
LLQAADFCLTRALLVGGVRSDVYEANPLANHILRRYGWAGLAGFKSACSLVALSAILLIWRHRAATGVRLLVVMCLVMGGVVGYSGALLAAPAESPEDLSVLVSQANDLNDSLAAMRKLDAERRAICRDLLEERIDLPKAVEQMRTCVARFAPAMRHCNRGDFPHPDDEDGLAGYVYHHATRLHAVLPGLSRQLNRLGSETSERYPAAPLFDARTMRGHIKPTFRATAGVNQGVVHSAG